MAETPLTMEGHDVADRMAGLVSRNGSHPRLWPISLEDAATVRAIRARLFELNPAYPAQALGDLTSLALKLDQSMALAGNIGFLCELEKHADNLDAMVDDLELLES